MAEPGVDQINSLAFQFEIEQVFLAPRQGTAVTGLVELGVVTSGARIDIHGMHARRQGIVAAIMKDGEQLVEAKTGELVTLLLTDLSPGHIANGMLVTQRGGERHKELRGRSHREYQGLAALAS
ncbi:MAG: hypothetical protein FWD29_03535 [Micrococcales bacterium]|nr:hypothetical protein [Micrococcales bacterium]